MCVREIERERVCVAATEGDDAARVAEEGEERDGAPAEEGRCKAT